MGEVTQSARNLLPPIKASAKSLRYPSTPKTGQAKGSGAVCDVNCAKAALVDHASHTQGLLTVYGP
jgi:hypothetical protein